MMAPAFSRVAWRCVWYMIQNDLIHAWGLDMQLGYCAQGDRSKNVGVMDYEYIVHYGQPTLGGLDVNEVSSRAKDHRVDVSRSLVTIFIVQTIGTSLNFTSVKSTLQFSVPKLLSSLAQNPFW